MLPKTGKFLPKGELRVSSEFTYAAAVALALRDALGDSHRAIKIVMRWTGASERTVKNWFAGTRGPRGEHLISLVRHRCLPNHPLRLRARFGSPPLCELPARQPLALHLSTASPVKKGPRD
jgi:hypothetical protein